MATVIFYAMQVLRVVTTLTRPFSDLVLDFLYGLWFGRTKPLPPVRDGLLLLPAVELAHKIRKRQVSCEEVMRAYVERSRAVHPLINAAVDHRYEDALQDARAVDSFLASGQKSEEEIEKDTPLLGVPFTCKEAIGVKGLAQTCGLFHERERKAPSDSMAAATYRRAGAIPYVVSNVPQLCMWWETSNAVFGLTLNPHDNRRTVGGSSGGEAALITSAAALIGIGNDVGGSIRIPCSFCGIYGHKPSRGLISNDGQMADWDNVQMYVSTGPMCRYAVDLPLLTRVLSDNNINVPWDAKVDFRKVKFYYMEEIPGLLTAADTKIKKAIRKAAKHFEDEFGVTAVRVEMDEMRYAFDIWTCKLLEAGSPPLKSALAGPKGTINLYWELFKCFLNCSEHTFTVIYFAMIDRREKDKYYYECLEIFKEMKRKLEQMLDGDAILFIPTQLEPPPHCLMTIPKFPNIGYTGIFCILGYPATQIPAGQSQGLPIGVQAVSRPNNDHLTIAAAVELDKVFKGWSSPSAVML